MPKNKINLSVKLNSAAQRSQEFMTSTQMGYSQKRSTIKDLIEKSFQNNIKSNAFKKLNTDNKIKYIVDIFNNKANVEYAHIVYKRTIGKDFKGFMFSPNEKTLRALSIVVRLKDSSSNPFIKNSIVFEVNLLKVDSSTLNTTTSQPIVTIFELQNVLLLNLPEKEHPIVRGMKQIGSDMNFNINNEQSISEGDHTWIAGLTKPIDIYTDDSKLRIGDWRTIMNVIDRFNDSKKTATINVFATHEDGVEINVENPKSKVQLLALIEKEQVFDNRTKYYVNNVNEASVKAMFKYQSHSENKLDEILEHIKRDKEHLVAKKNQLAIKVDELTETISDHNDEIDKVEVKKDGKINEINEAGLNIENKKMSFVNPELIANKIMVEAKTNVQNVWNKIVEMKRELSRNENISKKNLSKLSSDEKKTRENTIIKIKNNINDETKTHKSLEKILDIKTKELKELKKNNLSELKFLEENLLKLQKDKNGYVSEIEMLRNVIAKFEKESKNIIQTKNNIFNEVEELEEKYQKIDKLKETMNLISINGILQIDDRSKKSIYISSFDTGNFIDNDVKYMENSTWELSDYDKGFATIIKRNLRAIKNLSFGDYKSPYLAISLSNPSIPLEINNSETSGNLNEKQKEAFRMINNSFQSSFLQGPPGTGKTQVISNIISHYANMNEISLISSSTNEAINNAMDRINRDQKKNPNVIFLRVSGSQKQLDKTKGFVEEAIPKNFINKMIFASKGKEADGSEAEEILKKYSKEEINSYMPTNYFDKFMIEETMQSNVPFFSKVLNMTIDKEDEEYFFEDSKSRVIRLKRKMSTMLVENEFAKTIESFFSERVNDINDYELSTYDFINQYVTNSSKTKFQELVNNVSANIENNGGLGNALHEKILETVSKNNLINVIGITTTSRQEIEINSVKRELFTDYPIDFAVVDEVSKSITPEIIQISTLASKFLYAGDYRQLPPAMDISKTYLEQFWNWYKKNPGDKMFDQLCQRNNIVDTLTLEEMFGDLYDKTLFKNQVRELKNKTGSGIQNSYVALDVQHRFTQSVADLVNVIYDRNEALKTFHPEEHFNKYEIDGVNSKSSVILIDTSYFSDAYISFVSKNKHVYLPSKNEVAFDQKMTTLGNGRRKFNARINEYNIFTSLETIMKLKNKNPNIKSEDIGYICMTRSQANLARDMINRNFKGQNWDAEWLSKIKIDTVDNFQGREKEIIIVDLVRAQNDFSENATKPSERATRNLDFYSRNERLNVAVSRAKAKLILVGAIEGHLGNGVISKVEIDGNESNIKIFDRYKEVIERENGVIRIWEK